MNFLKNYSAVLGWVNVIRGAGALLLAKMTNKNLQTKNDLIIAPPPEIGGGGITNPKPPKK